MWCGSVVERLSGDVPYPCCGMSLQLEGSVVSLAADGKARNVSRRRASFTRRGAHDGHHLVAPVPSDARRICSQRWLEERDVKAPGRRGAGSRLCATILLQPMASISCGCRSRKRRRALQPRPQKGGGSLWNGSLSFCSAPRANWNSLGRQKVGNAGRLYRSTTPHHCPARQIARRGSASLLLTLPASAHQSRWIEPSPRCWNKPQ